jgi:hypothetical protein
MAKRKDAERKGNHQGRLAQLSPFIPEQLASVGWVAGHM